MTPKAYSSPKPNMTPIWESMASQAGFVAPHWTSWRGFLATLWQQSNQSCRGMCSSSIPNSYVIESGHPKPELPYLVLANAYPVQS